MKALVKILILIFPATCFGSDYIRLSVDESRKVLKQCTRFTPKQDISNYWKVSGYLSDLVEENITKVKNLDPTYTRGKQTLQKLNKYDFQLAGVTIGELKYIYINAVQKRVWQGSGTKNEGVAICGGGNNSWGVLFNPANKYFTRLAINDER